MNNEELIGQRFGRLVIEKILKSSGKTRAIVKCDCGNVKEVDLYSVRKGLIVSCRCFQRERILERCGTHKLSKHPLFAIYNGIKSRCYNPNRKAYKNYGGRGIIMCDEWRNDFKTFYDWSLSNGWEKGLHIDRIDNNGNYTPDNCRYTTPKQNSRNRRSTVMIEYDGETKALSAWAEQFNIDLKALWRRIYKLGMSLHDAIHYQPKISKVTKEIALEIYHSSKTTTALAKQFNLNSGTVWQIRNGSSYIHFTSV